MPGRVKFVALTFSIFQLIGWTNGNWLGNVGSFIKQGLSSLSPKPTSSFSTYQNNYGNSNLSIPVAQGIAIANSTQPMGQQPWTVDRGLGSLINSSSAGQVNTPNQQIYGNPKSYENYSNDSRTSIPPYQMPSPLNSQAMFQPSAPPSTSLDWNSNPSNQSPSFSSNQNSSNFASPSMQFSSSDPFSSYGQYQSPPSILNSNYSPNTGQTSPLDQNQSMRYSKIYGQPSYSNSFTSNSYDNTSGYQPQNLMSPQPNQQYQNYTSGTNQSLSMMAPYPGRDQIQSNGISQNLNGLTNQFGLSTGDLSNSLNSWMGGLGLGQVDSTNTTFEMDKGFRHGQNVDIENHMVIDSNSLAELIRRLEGMPLRLLDTRQLASGETLIQRALMDPNSDLPWRWRDQCYNENMVGCAPQFLGLLKQIVENVRSSGHHHNSNGIRTNGAGVNYNTNNGKGAMTIDSGLAQNVFREVYQRMPMDSSEELKKSLFLMLAGELYVVPDKRQPAPLVLFTAMEILLEFGFHAIESPYTNILQGTLGIHPTLLNPRDHLVDSLKTSLRFGLYRLAGAIIQVGKFQFAFHDTNMQSILYVCREQPLSLATILSITRSPNRESIKEQMQYGTRLPIVKAIYEILSIPPIDEGKRSMICATGVSNSHRIPIRMSTLTRGFAANLDQLERFTLARAFLLIVFGIPLNHTVYLNHQNIQRKQIQEQGSHGVNSAAFYANTLLNQYCHLRSNFKIVE